MSNPLFTIILPTSIDRGLLLPYSIGSVQKQTIPSFELFIIGDGVNDFTREVIRDLQEKDSRIHFFDHPKHPRRGEEYRHQALQSARGKYVAYITDRDYWLPHHLETLEKYLQTYDFASTLNYDVKDDYMIFGRKNLDAWDAPSWLFSCDGHTLEMYKRLPYGWRTTPKHLYTDRYMWEQFITFPECKAYCGLEPTVLWFKRGDFPGLSSEQRKELMIKWIKIMEDPALFQLKKDHALHEMMWDFNFLHRNHWLLIKGRTPKKALKVFWEKIKSRLSPG
ncbi:MAG: glycosyltransferase family 2 protein [Cytophagales bacterium]|nr:MAG: glycosyltransferase family 2 protein [Cytophagales bacterium]